MNEDIKKSLDIVYAAFLKVNPKRLEPYYGEFQRFPSLCAKGRPHYPEEYRAFVSLLARRKFDYIFFVSEISNLQHLAALGYNTLEIFVYNDRISFSVVDSIASTTLFIYISSFQTVGQTLCTFNEIEIDKDKEEKWAKERNLEAVTILSKYVIKSDFFLYTQNNDFKNN